MSTPKHPMERLYAKLYEKYTSAKNQQLSVLDELNKDQEHKFVNYVNRTLFSSACCFISFSLTRMGYHFSLIILVILVAEEMMQTMKNENDRLRDQVTDLRTQVASLRHDFRLPFSYF
ncbi:hypothetical protein Tsubulata_023882 [Turnera subulata]|uniref:Uncharacterized protein n=1 Tax=Turnera subulata TaxID=218843 RepID=A0A9Q0G084_9ROSI|nr:hypothetical protein Tsubulata_023882 [Turnera subulata]